MKYFTLKELTKSSVATSNRIDNTPNDQQKSNLIALVDNVLDPLREKYGKPIIVTSGFRSKELNTKINGAKNSQHLDGCAVDIRSVSDSKQENKKLFELALDLPFDQLINEYDYDWVHISYSPKHRRQVLQIK